VSSDRAPLNADAVLAFSADAIVAVDSDFRVVVWNPAAERMFGFTKAEAVGRNVYELTATSKGLESIEPVRTAAHAGQAHPDNLINVAANDRAKHFGVEIAQCLTGFTFEQLKRLLQLQDIALAARHDASDRGAVKEGRRQALEVAEQLGAQAIQYALPNSSNGDELEVIGPEVHQGDAEEDEPHDMQPPQVPTVDAPVDPMHDH
jgi:nitrogen-specific signal transduction histidine kinase